MRRVIVAAMLVGLAAPMAADATEQPNRAQASWDGLDVPYTSVPGDPIRNFGRVAVRFHDTQVPFREFSEGITSVAASVDSAVVAAVDYSQEEFAGPLFEISADGTTGVVEKHVLGIPMADPLGHHVFWTSRRKSKARLMAYDTLTHARIPGPVVRRGVRVYAVDDDEAFVSGGFEGPPGARVWSPGQDGFTVMPLPSTDDDGEAFVSDVAGDLVLSTDFERTVISDRMGNVLTVLPPRLFLGTFSPDARYVARGGVGVQTLVRDLGTGANVDLRGLGHWRPGEFRWSPTGALVLIAERRGQSWDDANPVQRFVCRLPSGRCDKLPGPSRVFFEPILPSSALGQFVTVMPYSRTSASKALRDYLRRN